MLPVLAAVGGQALRLVGSELVKDVGKKVVTDVAGEVAKRGANALMDMGPGLVPGLSVKPPKPPSTEEA